MRYLLHDVFTDTVNNYPQSVAIYQESGNSYTYSELNSLSNKFANIFSRYKGNIRDNPFIGVLSSVNPNSIAAILGCLKIGCAYIPLDENSPADRLDHIVQNTNLDMLVIDPFWYKTHKEFIDRNNIQTVIFSDHFEDTTTNIITFDQIVSAPSNEPPQLNQVSDDLAYILHSSGSTGVPKGIMLTHRNARTFVDWMQKEFEISSDDVIMSRAPFKFDLSIFDIFNTFKVGAKLICFDWNIKRLGDKKHTDFVQLMKKQNVNTIYTTPSTFIALMNRGDLKKARLPLKRAMYAGEPFPPAQLRKLMDCVPGINIANIYGPTETNIITCWWIKDPPRDNESIPLGHVVDDTEIIVVSEDGHKICKENEIGELWCRGGTVTLGYLGMPEKNTACLVDSPFHKYPAKFWRTGDFGYKDENGILHYKGRRDHMVKVKGFRIELGEIESALSSYDIIDEFCVIAIPDEKYGNKLYCFYSAIPTKKINQDDLIMFLSKKIPSYMLPFKFIEKKYLPKTSSDKIDRVLLSNEINQQ